MTRPTDEEIADLLHECALKVHYHLSPSAHHKRSARRSLGDCPDSLCAAAREAIAALRSEANEARESVALDEHPDAAKTVRRE